MSFVPAAVVDGQRRTMDSVVGMFPNIVQTLTIRTAILSVRYWLMLTDHGSLVTVRRT